LNFWLHHGSQQPQIERSLNQNIFFYLNLESKSNIIPIKLEIKIDTHPKRDTNKNVFQDLGFIHESTKSLKKYFEKASSR